MPDFAVQAHAAAFDALTMSGLSEAEVQNPETGLIFGCDSSCIAAIEQVDLLRERGETKLIGSGHVFRSMTSCITMNLNTHGTSVVSEIDSHCSYVPSARCWNEQ